MPFSRSRIIRGLVNPHTSSHMQLMDGWISVLNPRMRYFKDPADLIDSTYSGNTGYITVSLDSVSGKLDISRVTATIGNLVSRV